VPAAVLLGVPMYTNAAGIIPIVEALIGKGAALGTVLAFMMSVIALSAPEMIILRKVLKPTLIATFAGVVATGILLVGYVFNRSKAGCASRVPRSMRRLRSPVAIVRALAARRSMLPMIA
jgi:uncharacterized membrane protein YraQ (UPF0718 family)